MYIKYGCFLSGNGMKPTQNDVTLAVLTTSPLGCCGAVGLQGLTPDAHYTDEITEIFGYLQITYCNYRGLFIIPVDCDNDGDHDDRRYIRRYDEIWVKPAVANGWRELGDTWINPKTSRVLQTFYKDFK
jgi:hypothetical protein